MNIVGAFHELLNFYGSLFVVADRLNISLYQMTYGLCLRGTTITLCIITTQEFMKITYIYMLRILVETSGDFRKQALSNTEIYLFYL